jgi:hypothetical protein
MTVARIPRLFFPRGAGRGGAATPSPVEAGAGLGNPCQEVGSARQAALSPAGPCCSFAIVGASPQDGQRWPSARGRPHFGQLSISTIPPALNRRVPYPGFLPAVHRVISASWIEALSGAGVQFWVGVRLQVGVRLRVGARLQVDVPPGRIPSNSPHSLDEMGAVDLRRRTMIPSPPLRAIEASTRWACRNAPAECVTIKTAHQ